MRNILVSILIAGFLVACAHDVRPVAVDAAPVTTWSIAWQTTGDAGNPLVGRIWDSRAQAWASPAGLRQALAAAHYVLLGETHDNPDHHRLQAELLQAVVDSGRHPAVAFEMFDLDQQPALTRFLADHPADAAKLGPAVDWADSGWPAWSMYQPIAEVALAAGLPIVAANLPSATVKAVALQGLDALDPAEVEALRLEEAWPQARTDAMLQEIYEGHCELMPKEALGGMVRAQRTRNAIMASRLLETADTDGGVLIAGAGHVRTDYGVPLEMANAVGSTLSVAMLEVEPDWNEPAAYAERYSVDHLPFDYVIFTPAATRDDPCEALRKRFGGDTADDD